MANPRQPMFKALAGAVIAWVYRNLRTGVPGVVQSYDDATQEALVVPAIRAKDAQGRPADKAPLRVPVAWFRGGGWAIQAGLDEGDTVHLDVLDRDLSLWQQQGGVVDQERTEAHNLRNSIARPDLYPRSDPLPPTNGALVIRRVADGAAEIKLQPDGRVEVTGAGGGAKVTITPAGQVEIDTGGALKFVTRDGDDVLPSLAFVTWAGLIAGATGVPNPWSPGVAPAVGDVDASSTTVRSS